MLEKSKKVSARVERAYFVYGYETEMLRQHLSFADEYIAALSAHH